jgi:hypothetical protein
VDNNALECVPSELADLQTLELLSVRLSRSDFSSRLTCTGLQLDSNQLRWLPIEFDRLPAATAVWVRSFIIPVPSGLTRCSSVVEQSFAAKLQFLGERAPSLSRALLRNDTHRHDP